MLGPALMALVFPLLLVLAFQSKGTSGEKHTFSSPGQRVTLQVLKAPPAAQAFKGGAPHLQAALLPCLSYWQQSGQEALLAHLVCHKVPHAQSQPLHLSLAQREAEPRHQHTSGTR